ncbi:integrase/recombinase XerC [Devosia sp. UYZn731]|uniref:hypothetical protein n=1 Tax=Devosia sp. UYZn731 TaxID=3156345 RepID=UPI00339101AA
MSDPRNSGASPSIDQWIASLAGKSASTRDCYARDVRQVAEAVGYELGRSAEMGDILAMDAARLRELAEKWAKAGDAPATIRRRLVSLRRYARFLAAEFQLSGPLFYSNFPIVEVTAAAPVPEDHLQALVIASDNRDAWTSLRDDAILTLISVRGLTTGELQRLDCRHLSGSFLLVRKPSGGLRLIDLPSEAVETIATYRQHCPYPVRPDDALWLNNLGGRMSSRSLQLMLRRRRAMAGLPPGVVAGAFRKRRILSLLASGIQIDRIAGEMGIGHATVLVHLRKE